MERVETLIEQLRNQIAAGKQVTELLQTVQMIQAELLHLQTAEQSGGQAASVALHIPSSFEVVLNPVNEEESKTEKITFTLDVDEQEIIDELEEIKRNAESKNLLSMKHRPQFRFDPIEDTPTLSQQIISENKPIPKEEPVVSEKPVESAIEIPAPEIPSPETPEINEQLKKPAREISDALSDAPIKDLKKAIGINDRFLYIQELFKGDEVMYDRSIKTINAFEAYAEAEFWIKRELKLKLGWNDKDETVRQFDHLVRRRFNMI